ncbi:MAG: 4-alpha-glucanotransferase [Candidatus Omnitrophica bacterium]|nr:4-alpha-glucanotransferase [Candidatus Omnitrophota bacterium]
MFTANLSQDKWKRIGLRKRSGILVSLFSVYSKDSLGIGDFEDLKLLIDWSKKSGNSIIQLLPMNDLGATFCPYDGSSSFALEPAYLSLGQIKGAQKRHFRKRIAEIKEKFPLDRPYLDYRIKKEKINLLWDIYLEYKPDESKGFKDFIRKNSYWVFDFALFKVLKDYQNDLPWYEWEEKYKSRDLKELTIFSRSHERKIDFQVWLQWQLYQQFKAIKKYAEKKKILLKGDLPILVSRDSADIWQHQEFFKLDFAAGAPPDMYTALGQRWGMPTYDWEKIRQDNYRYLLERLKYAAEFYGLLRIDHVVGLFRIWSIPDDELPENKGLNGFFDPSDESKWGKQGKEILSFMLKNTNMLLCAEDLGVIPKICPQTLKELGIPGNDVQRWRKDWKIKHDFLKAQEYRQLSVAMLSTHDTTNWPAWWENEAGTVDEQLFIHRCTERGIDYTKIKEKLFDPQLSRNGRLRWLNSVTSAKILVDILGKPKEVLVDFIEIYENSFKEKEKLWRHLKLDGQMREKSDSEILKAALKVTLDAQSIFSIQLITDWLYLADIFKGDPYQYRLNTPGTISAKNWSQLLPLSLDKLLRHPVTSTIRKLIAASGRI